jgi:hypothetical protein
MRTFIVLVIILMSSYRLGAVDDGSGLSRHIVPARYAPVPLRGHWVTSGLPVIHVYAALSRLIIPYRIQDSSGTDTGMVTLPGGGVPAALSL